MKVFIQEAAERDILSQVAWYAEKGLVTVPRRFHAAVLAAIDSLVAMPEAGSPRMSGNPALAGLRAWPSRGSARSGSTTWCARND